MDSQSAPASVGTCNRSGSPALSEMSELSVLSRTPSPPPESSQAHAITDCKPTQGPMRDSCGRYLPRKKKRAASPSNGPRKKHKGLTRTKSRTLAVKPHDNFFNLSPHKGISAHTAGAGGNGTLDRLPKEIRQIIYGYVLNVSIPVSPKECCGPNATQRERDACRKHGNNCRKIADSNGIHPDEFQRPFGQFSILAASRSINHEASWVLFNQGSLFPEVNDSIAMGLEASLGRLSHRLRAPAACKAKVYMWIMAARFRHIRIVIPDEVIHQCYPEQYTYHLQQVAQSLLKAMDMQAIKPTSEITHDVTVNLGCFFDYTAPLDFPGVSFVDCRLWMTSNNAWDSTSFQGSYWEFILQTTRKQVESFVRIAGKRRDNSKWTVTAAPVDDREGKNAGAIWRDYIAAQCCDQNIEFLTTV